MSIEAIRAALEAGPTDGKREFVIDCGERQLKIDGKIVMSDTMYYPFIELYDADWILIAACNPSAIRELLDRLDAAEKKLAALEGE